MRSGELARLAGVTVRALRHYHQVGVLAEPGRDLNGYRRYDVHDLIRVLRIKRLAALGLALEQMPALLDDTGADTDGLLDALDRELAGQIRRLSAQREVVARLRDHRAAPDLPPELAPFLAAWSAGLSPDVARMDRDQSVLLAHLAGPEGVSQLARFYERLDDPALIQDATVLTERFGRLDAQSTDADILELVEAFAALVGPVVQQFATEPPIDLGGAAQALTEYTADLLNPAQQRALALLEERLEDVGET
ncbi:MerR family transcriptional regulator [Georgenia faecalis]|uniref:MerR family transcriptional regulator n=1 Tax=Georgenia faecalis TaxID=2483799 RepID=A0ABV9D9N7_9MICO|nr:MerR family transcriptional regulator [Georgenia faecalis]